MIKFQRVDEDTMIDNSKPITIHYSKSHIGIRFTLPLMVEGDVRSVRHRMNFIGYHKVDLYCQLSFKHLIFSYETDIRFPDINDPDFTVYRNTRDHNLTKRHPPRSSVKSVLDKIS